MSCFVLVASEALDVVRTNRVPTRCSSSFFRNGHMRRCFDNVVKHWQNLCPEELACLALVVYGVRANCHTLSLRASSSSYSGGGQRDTLQDAQAMTAAQDYIGQPLGHPEGCFPALSGTHWLRMLAESKKARGLLTRVAKQIGRLVSARSITATELCLQIVLLAEQCFPLPGEKLASKYKSSRAESRVCVIPHGLTPCSTCLVAINRKNRHPSKGSRCLFGLISRTWRGF